jgi:hypothetical protein
MTLRAYGELVREYDTRKRRFFATKASEVETYVFEALDGQLRYSLVELFEELPRGRSLNPQRNPKHELGWS